MSKSIQLGLFLIVALLQLYVPAQMIFSREAVLNTGKAFRFETRPIDPSDPFRGKYVVLDFEANRLPMPPGWEMPDPPKVYVELIEGSDQFTQISQIHLTPPAHTSDYVKASVRASGGSSAQLIVEYPFDRFYMDEYKAGPAEDWFREANRDTTVKTYALVYVQDGTAVIHDVLIGGQSIKTVLDQ